MRSADLVDGVLRIELKGVGDPLAVDPLEANLVAIVQGLGLPFVVAVALPTEVDVPVGVAVLRLRTVDLELDDAILGLGLPRLHDVIRGNRAERQRCIVFDYPVLDGLPVGRHDEVIRAVVDEADLDVDHAALRLLSRLPSLRVGLKRGHGSEVRRTADTEVVLRIALIGGQLIVIVGDEHDRVHLNGIVLGALHGELDLATANAVETVAGARHHGTVSRHAGDLGVGVVDELDVPSPSRSSKVTTPLSTSTSSASTSAILTSSASLASTSKSRAPASSASVSVCWNTSPSVGSTLNTWVLAIAESCRYRYSFVLDGVEREGASWSWSRPRRRRVVWGCPRGGCAP
ncbi:hypothetical protein ER308_15125 [Egibacter rhizosphaerae]|uniref:Uncharacterized protein n=1 Tax=Egibacter rhizosphaerae TaxID=1670831 RepID=A0A411YHR9_9ACTN|nr:hypothetical protein [Egibacter rhizosphaerae]QBI20763.1 hypothetical protein ER308_15125 [Egibacter rhizosphaerae]